MLPYVCERDCHKNSAVLQAVDAVLDRNNGYLDGDANDLFNKFH